MFITHSMKEKEKREKIQNVRSYAIGMCKERGIATLNYATIITKGRFSLFVWPAAAYCPSKHSSMGFVWWHSHCAVRRPSSN